MNQVVGLIDLGPSINPMIIGSLLGVDFHGLLIMTWEPHFGFIKERDNSKPALVSSLSRQLQL